jgi:GT2 family glycosyltransferase
VSSSIEIIIPSWNGKALLGDCLVALSRQTRIPDRITVVDNHSGDGTREFLAREWGDVCVVELDENKGFAAAVQAGIESSIATLVGVLNNDARPHPEWLESLEQAFAWPRVGACASLVLSGHRIVESAGVGFSHFGVGFRLGEHRSVDALPQELVEVFGVSGTAAMFLREALLEAQGFDPHFFAQGEDIDVSFRLRYAGYSCLLNPMARVSHLGSRTLVRMGNQYLALAQRNLEWVFWCNFPLWTWPLWGVLHTFYQSASLLRHTMIGTGKVVLEAKLTAFRLLPELMRRRRQPQGFAKRILPWLGATYKPWPRNVQP